MEGGAEEEGGGLALVAGATAGAGASARFPTPPPFLAVTALLTRSKNWRRFTILDRMWEGGGGASPGGAVERGVAGPA